VGLSLVCPGFSGREWFVRGREEVSIRDVFSWA
jgi:hypothetical protein